MKVELLKNLKVKIFRNSISAFMETKKTDFVSRLQRCLPLSSFFDVRLAVCASACCCFLHFHVDVDIFQNHCGKILRIPLCRC